MMLHYFHHIYINMFCLTDSGNTSSWQLKKPGYSYTSQGSLKRQADDDDEFDFNETKKGNFERDQSSSQRFDQTTHQNNTITNKGIFSIISNALSFTCINFTMLLIYKTKHGKMFLAS